MNKLEKGIYGGIRDLNDEIISNILEGDFETDIIDKFYAFQYALKGILLEAGRPHQNDVVTEGEAGVQLILYAMGMVDLNIQEYQKYLKIKDLSKCDIRKTVLLNQGINNPHAWQSISFKELLANKEEAIRFIEPISYCNSDLDLDDAEWDEIQAEIKKIGFNNVEIDKIYDIYVESLKIKTND
ncbi:hypothetical protein HCA69_15960 [Listeria grandensis]|uniref:Uncharacterized protein n=1 Tax=Listeria grandensis TaxID=1494963 RepID=A0A7X0Y6E5_9LIST|nr:hypothetical protein [Listeria grandensis]MBC1937859.1 hypothetical protein [Listeria grandensis]